MSVLERLEELERQHAALQEQIKSVIEVFDDRIRECERCLGHLDRPTAPIDERASATYSRQSGQTVQGLQHMPNPNFPGRP